MTTYHIEHRTTYTYDSDVTGSYGLVHLRPRDLDWQTCVAHEISIEPEPGRSVQAR
jgi:transglutaminase-like putative cysteine protease